MPRHRRNLTLRQGPEKKKSSLFQRCPHSQCLKHTKIEVQETHTHTHLHLHTVQEFPHPGGMLNCQAELWNKASICRRARGINCSSGPLLSVSPPSVILPLIPSSLLFHHLPLLSALALCFSCRKTIHQNSVQHYRYKKKKKNA